jgi:hypothetical protein
MDSFLTRSAKKLEQALGVPRPWELTPATSVGYQMATGEGSIGERARKGTAQFLGRYATNIKQPYDYRLTGYGEDYPSIIKSVVKDRPSWIDENFFGQVAARDVLYREMFDLPTRTETSDIEKTGEKQYRLKDSPQPRPMTSSKPFPHSMSGHDILRGVYFQPTPEGNYRYDDVWDIVSPSDIERTDVSARLRKLIAPILRPATVSGEVPARYYPAQ